MWCGKDRQTDAGDGDADEYMHRGKCIYGERRQMRSSWGIRLRAFGGSCNPPVGLEAGDLSSLLLEHEVLGQLVSSLADAMMVIVD